MKPSSAAPTRTKEEEITALINEAIWNYQHNQDETGRTNLIGAKQEIHMALEAPPAAERTALAKALIAWWDKEIDSVNWNTEKGLGWFTFWGIVKALDPKNPRIAQVEETFGMVIKSFDAASASEGTKSE